MEVNAIDVSTVEHLEVLLLLTESYVQTALKHKNQK